MSHEVSERAPDVEWGWEALGGHTAPGALFGPQGLGGAFGALVGPKRLLRSLPLFYLALRLWALGALGPFWGPLWGLSVFCAVYACPTLLRLGALGTFWGPWGPF